MARPRLVSDLPMTVRPDQERQALIEKVTAKLREIAELRDAPIEDLVPDFVAMSVSGHRSGLLAPKSSMKNPGQISLEGKPKYKERANRRLGPIDFLRLEYKDVLDTKLLTLCAIKEHDFPLYQAIQHYKRTYPLPEDIVLLTKQDVTEFYLAQQAMGKPVPRDIAHRLRHVRYDRAHRPDRRAPRKPRGRAPD